MQLQDAVEKYDVAARYYDRFMDVVFDRVLDVERQRARVIELIGDIEGCTVLDVGCGTGRNFPLLQQAVGKDGRIIGLDCSRGMLEQASRRIERHGWGNIELMIGDAVTLEGIPSPVDVVVSVWCYGTVYDITGALNRGIDVLVPGGRLGIITFTRAAPERGFLRLTYPLYLFALRCAGVDPTQDFDNAGLEEKWRIGRQILSSRLDDLHEEPYWQGAGLVVAGRRPLQDADQSERARPSANISKTLAGETPPTDRAAAFHASRLGS